MSITVQVHHWCCPHCGCSLNRQFCLRPIRDGAVTCRRCGARVTASRRAVIGSWRIAVQTYGIGVIWLAAILLSLVVPWARTWEDGLIAAALLGWMAGLFPGFLFTTPLGNCIGAQVANRLGLKA